MTQKTVIFLCCVPIKLLYQLPLAAPKPPLPPLAGISCLSSVWGPAVLKRHSSPLSLSHWATFQIFCTLFLQRTPYCARSTRPKLPSNRSSSSTVVVFVLVFLCVCVSPCTDSSLWCPGYLQRSLAWGYVPLDYIVEASTMQSMGIYTCLMAWFFIESHPIHAGPSAPETQP